MDFSIPTDWQNRMVVVRTISGQIYKGLLVNMPSGQSPVVILRAPAMVAGVSLECSWIVLNWKNVESLSV